MFFLFFILYALNLFPLEFKSEETPTEFNDVDCPCPIMSARSAPDQYLVKIVSECVEMLSNTYRLFNGEPEKIKDRRKVDDLESEYHKEWIPNLMEYNRKRWNEIYDGKKDLNKFVTSKRPPRIRNQNHPMSVWVRSSHLHYLWTCYYGLELTKIHLERLNVHDNKKKYQPHLYIPYLEWYLKNSPFEMNDGVWCSMPKCMDDDCIDSSGGSIGAVLSSRNWVRKKYEKGVISWSRDLSTKPEYI